MHLKHLEITNFRAISELSIDLAPGANLLVGPNAVGKTTVLEAVRFAKAMLVPRTANEGRQVLSSLGVVSQHLPQQLNFSAIAGDTKTAVTIRCTFELSESDISQLPQLVDSLAQYVVAAQHGIGLDTGPLALIQFLSSPTGVAALARVNNELIQAIANFTTTKLCNISLIIDPRLGIRGEDLVSHSLFAVLEKELPPNSALFSYFPADRAMPAGEAQIQIGSADAQQHLESHNSSPSLKYQRLKNVIFSTLVESDESKQQQKAVFEEIFETLLKEKRLESLSVNRFGQASIQVRDIASDKVFDIDSMSSGEKGLILTFLLISRAIAPGGIVLIDEPELHLNSAVCKDLLSFLMDRFLGPKKIQAIICTHSPEIMSAALRREDCKVFHLRRGAPVCPIRKHDQPEAVQALKLLGTSEIEELLYEATIFVEGPDDVELLEYAFRNDLGRFKFRELMGRGEVEKHIRKLQEADKKHQKENISYFIFDWDNSPAGLPSTNKVIVKQWGRYCLENYLLEPEVLYDFVRTEGKPKNWPSCLSEAEIIFSKLAKKQLHSRIIDEIYRSYGFADIRIRVKDKASDFAGSAKNLFSKINDLKSQVEQLSEHSWIADFEQKCAGRLAETEVEWNARWIEQCSGKQFFRDLNQYADGLGLDMASFKRRLLGENRNADSASWKAFGGAFKELIKPR